MPSHSDGNTLDVERGDHARDVAREPGEHEAIAEVQRRRLLLEPLPQRSLADDEEPRARPLGEHEPGGIDQVRVPFRLVQARHRADREIIRGDPELLARRADLVRPCAGG